jgi:Spy/CpxP family protein refolding chaperone
MNEAESKAPRGGRWLVAAGSLVLVGGLLVLVLGTAGLVPSLADARPWARLHPGGGDHEAFLDYWVDRALGKIDATEEQRERVRAVIEGLHQQAEGLHGSSGEVHAAFEELFTAEQVDSVEVERLRSEQMDRFDRLSRELASALVELGEILTPEQRQKLLELHEHRGRHRMH